MPDQKLAAPYGDIVFVNTPNLDRMGATFYLEDQRKKKQEQEANDLLDAQFSKELAGIRSVDVPELTTKYDAMKRLKQSTYNTNKLSTKERIALQQEAIKATADTYQTINQSKEAKTLLGTIQADQKKNPNNYAPEYTDLMVTALSLPTNKLRNFDTGKKDVNGNPIIIDFTNPDTYAYKLGSTDFSKEGKFAMGDIKQKRGNTLSIDTPDKMGTINVEYTGINSPDQYLSNLQHSVVGSKKTSDFIKEAQPLIADEANIINSFDELTKTEAFKNAYPDFKGFNPMLMNTELGKAMILSAMKAHIISPPREVKSNPIPKWKKREDYKEGQKKAMEALKNKYIKERMLYKKSLGLSDEQDETTGVVFDEIGGEKDVDTFTSDTKFGIPYAKKAGRISKGIVFDESGNVMADGEVSIKKEDLPANMIVVLNNQKMTVPPVVKVIVKNGEINGVNTNSGIVDRNGMMNFQKVYNKEPLKGSQLNFGKKSGNNKPFQNKKTFNVINPQTGEVIMSGVDEAAANKAKSKGYKIN